MKDKQAPTFGNGKICYLHIPSMDIRSSAAFYKNVFNWNIREREDGSISFDDGVGEVSGAWILGLEPVDGHSIALSIMVNSIADSNDLIIKYGGEVLNGDEQGEEKFGQFKDPSGNIFGIYQHNTKA